LTALAACGCKKSEGPAESKGGSTNAAAEPAKAATPSASEPIARLHWIGKKKLAADTNSAYLMTIWNLPESAKLEEQTLNKLAIAPWLSTLSNRPPVITNYDVVVAGNEGASLLRPLLDDLLQEEWHLEVRSEEVQSPKSKVQSQGSEVQSPKSKVQSPEGAEITLAIRLDEKRDELWRTNLTKVHNSLLSEPTIHDSPFTNHLAFARSGPWTLVSLGSQDSISGEDVLRRMAGTESPAPGLVSNSWLEARLQLPRLSRVFGGDLSDAWPTLALAMNGDGMNVRTRADLDFSKPLGIELEPWNIPTNLIQEPLIGFMAIRGIRSWLQDFKPWQDLKLGTAPNELYFWAQRGAPFQHFFAWPSDNASNQLGQINKFLLDKVNPALAPRVGQFETKTNEPEHLLWHGVPLFEPHVDYTNGGACSVVFGGFGPSSITNPPIPQGLVQQVTTATNLFWYDWEITQPCVDGLTELGQLLRIVLGRAQLPPKPCVAWLFAAGAKLGNSITGAKLISPTKISVFRSSSIGLTGSELEAVVDWLESPDFPHGFYTALAPVPPLINPLLHRTNLPPVLPSSNATNRSRQFPATGPQQAR
jgi:hypothetical protein